MTSVRAAVLMRSGDPGPFASTEPIQVRELQLDHPGAGELTIKIHAAGLCHSDLSVINGDRPRPVPIVLGHESAGVVEAVGRDVTYVKPGDRVVLHWRKGAGLESVTPTYRSRLGTVNAGWVTTFNDHAIVSENRVTAVPPEGG